MKIVILIDVNKSHQIATAWVNKAGDTVMYRPNLSDGMKRYEVTVDVPHPTDAEKIDCILKELL